MRLLEKLQPLVEDQETKKLLKTLIHGLTKILGLAPWDDEDIYGDRYELTDHQGRTLLEVTAYDGDVRLYLPIIDKSLPTELKDYVRDTEWLVIGDDNGIKRVRAYLLEVTPDNVNDILQYVSRISSKLRKLLAEVIQQTNLIYETLDLLKKEAKKLGFEFKDLKSKYANNVDSWKFLLNGKTTLKVALNVDGLDIAFLANPDKTFVGANCVTTPDFEVEQGVKRTGYKCVVGYHVDFQKFQKLIPELFAYIKEAADKLLSKTEDGKTLIKKTAEAAEAALKEIVDRINRLEDRVTPYKVKTSIQGEYAFLELGYSFKLELKPDSASFYVDNRAEFTDKYVDFSLFKRNAAKLKRGNFNVASGWYIRSSRKWRGYAEGDIIWEKPELAHVYLPLIINKIFKGV